MLSAYIYIAPKPLLDLPQVSWRQSYNTIGYEGEILSKTELFGITIAHGLAVREVVKNILTFLENKKVAIWIVSASPEVTVQAAMNYFKIPGKLIGLRNKMVSDVLQSEVEKPYSIAEGKVECVKTYIDPTQRPLLGIGDTMNDFPMIEYATIHAVIDRGNALTKEARARNWHVL
jgi:phosphoserine phosphatase